MLAHELTCVPSKARIATRGLRVTDPCAKGIRIAPITDEMIRTRDRMG